MRCGGLGPAGVLLVVRGVAPMKMYAQAARGRAATPATCTGRGFGHQRLAGQPLCGGRRRECGGGAAPAMRDQYGRVGLRSMHRMRGAGM